MTFDLSRASGASNVSPRYCPRCRRDRSAEARLCFECGEALSSKGFCDICEHFWRLPIGASCPKHELPLETGPVPIASPFEPGEQPRWETVGIYDHALEAGAPRLRLEAEGIPTFLDGERMGNHHAAASGGVRLQVPRRWFIEARELLCAPGLAFHDELAADDDGDDPDDNPELSLKHVVKWALLALFGLVIVAGLARLLRG
jgi:hypothetical protein